MGADLSPLAIRDVTTCIPEVGEPIIGRCEPSSPISEGDPIPAECEEMVATGCPQIIGGKVPAAGITVANRLHTFKFEGPMTRIGTGRRSPARYNIAHPTASEDTWWVAESGWIGLRCRGVFIPINQHEDRWFGTVSYAGENDLHMVMGPGHPDF